MKTQEQTRSFCSGAPVASLVIIVVLNLLFFGNSLTGYFLADDFVHIDYLVGLSEGGAGKLWTGLLQNFYTNWMQAEGTTFYRPLISLTLAFDYLLGKSNPFFFHLTNLFYHTSCAVLLALITKRLIDGFWQDEAKDQTVPSTMLPFAAGVLFSLYPLHCEVINWIIARVDSVALAFNLLAFYLFLIKAQSQDKNRTLTFCCLFAFILSLMSKEMAVTLPAVATAYLMLTPQGKNEKPISFLAKLRQSLLQSGFLWLTVLAYMGFRTVALGTISGGYQGSIGQGLSDSLVKRWTDGSLWRVLFPVNQEVFGANHKLYKALKNIYGLAIINLVLSAFWLRGKRWQPVIRLALFCAIWFVIDLAPTYQVWNLLENLQGGRFAYFATTPLMLFLALLMLLPWLLIDFESIKTNTNRVLTFCAAIALTMLVATYGQITWAHNQVWVKAQREVQKFREALDQVSKEHSGQIAILNIPQSYKGAHMLYNAPTMSVMLKPPLTGSDIRERVITFEPATFGDANLVQSLRLKDLVSQGNNYFYQWDRQKQILRPLALTAPKSTAMLPLLPAPVTINAGQSLVSPPLKINPLDYDCLLVRASGAKSLILTINGDSTHRLNASIEPGQNQATFNLSERKEWDSLPQVTELKIQADNSATISQLALTSLDGKLPLLACDGKDLKLDNDGVARIKGAKASFNFDVSHIKGAASALFELSGANSWFEHYSGTFRDKQPSKEAGLSGTLSQVKGKNIPLTFTGVKGHGFFELRIIALDKEGKVLGYFSEPLCFQL